MLERNGRVYKNKHIKKEDKQLDTIAKERKKTNKRTGAKTELTNHKKRKTKKQKHMEFVAMGTTGQRGDLYDSVNRKTWFFKKKQKKPRST